MFAAQVRALRQTVPHLPEVFADPIETETRLERMIAHGRALAAVEKGELQACLGWYIVNDFRGPDRRGAFCPVWATQSRPESAARAVPALYRAAAQRWTEDNCRVHALSLLAGDAHAERAWFWAGYGMVVVDAIRPVMPVGAPVPAGLTLRRATRADIPALVDIEAEHWRHYAASPLFMVANSSSDAAEWDELLADEGNNAWLAETPGGETAAYLRLEGISIGASELVRSPQTVAITGAYTRPAFRGRGAAPALLDAALAHYAAHGRTRCSVDFESFNPEAAAFWPRYFTPISYSLMRYPEGLN